MSQSLQEQEERLSIELRESIRSGQSATPEGKEKFQAWLKVIREWKKQLPST